MNSREAFSADKGNFGDTILIFLRPKSSRGGFAIALGTQGNAERLDLINKNKLRSFFVRYI
jgi:hypothetical protein